MEFCCINFSRIKPEADNDRRARNPDITQQSHLPQKEWSIDEVVQFLAGENERMNSTPINERLRPNSGPKVVSLHSQHPDISDNQSDSRSRTNIDSNAEKTALHSLPRDLRLTVDEVQPHTAMDDIKDGPCSVSKTPLGPLCSWENEAVIAPKMPPMLNLSNLMNSPVPFLKGRISIEDGTHVLKGKWALSFHEYEGDGVKSEFKYTCLSSKTEEPESGLYKGYFNMLLTDGMTETHHEKNMFLRFEKYDEYGYNIFGSGVHETFGAYQLKGHFGTEVEMYRIFLSSYREIPRQYRPSSLHTPDRKDRASGKENRRYPFQKPKNYPSSSAFFQHQRRQKRPFENIDNPFPRWTRIVSFREFGLTAGRADIYFSPPDGKKLRSRPDIVKYYASKGDLSPPLQYFNWNPTFCVCKTLTFDDELVPCQLGAGGCNGFVHPKCVQMDHITKTQWDMLKFLCTPCAEYQGKVKLLNDLILIVKIPSMPPQELQLQTNEGAGPPSVTKKDKVGGKNECELLVERQHTRVIVYELECKRCSFF